MLRRCPVITKSIPEVRLTVPGPPSAKSAADQEPEKNQRPPSAGNMGQSLAASDGGIHVYAHQRSERTIRATRSSLEKVGDTLR